MRNKKQSLDSSHTRNRTKRMMLKRILVMILVVVLCNQQLSYVYALGAGINDTKTQEVAQEKDKQSDEISEQAETTDASSTKEPETKEDQKEETEEVENSDQPDETENKEENAEKQTDFDVVIEKAGTDCYVGESISFTVSVSKETEITDVKVTAKQNKEESILYSENNLPKSLQVTSKQSGELFITAEVTNSQGITKKESVTIQCKEQESGTKEAWEDEVSKVELTNVSWTKDLVRIAESQIGYKESEANGNTVFVLNGLKYAKIPPDGFPVNADFEKWIKELKAQDLYAEAGEQTPSVGDLVFIKSKDDTKSVGIISKVNKANGNTETIDIITKIEDGLVDKVTYETTDKRLLGYGELSLAEEHYKRSYSDETLSIAVKGIGLKEEQDLRVKQVEKTMKITSKVEQAVKDYAENNAINQYEISELLEMQVWNTEGQSKEVPSVSITGQYSAMKQGTSVVYSVTVTKDSKEILIQSLDLEDTTIDYMSEDVQYVAFVAMSKEDAQDQSTYAVSQQASSTTEEGPLVENHKRIDYLGDGIKNPDTNLTGDGLYRLYLDVVGTYKSKGLDLLIVVDRSGSMSQTDMSGNKSRSDVINDLLKGTNVNTGFIMNFLSSNTENKVAVISFEGNAAIENKDASYTDDSSMLLDWQSSSSITSATIKNLNVKYKTNNGTNYSAGLIRADQMFASSKVNDGNDKVMIFLSDGVPTYYFNGLTDKNRGGTGAYNNVQNVNNCKQPAKTSFDAFLKNNSNVKTYTIGVSKDINSTNDITHSPEVLKYMADKGNGSFLAAVDASQLANAFNSVLKVTNVKIVDTLSQYVNLYSQQADLVLTKTNTSTNESTIIWEGQLDSRTNSIGSAKNGGGSIIKNVTYSPELTDTSTGKVEVEFQPTYQVTNEYKFTVSFNVQVTDKAIEDKAGNNNEYTDTGDKGTDYTGNTTSSLKEGFFSNALAQVEYNDKTSPYEKPVVQCANPTASLSIKKEGQNSIVLPGVTFAIYKAVVSNGVWTESGEAIESKDTNSEGIVAFHSLKPGTYLLYEKKTADGYVLPTDPWRVTVDKYGKLTVTDSRGTAVEKKDCNYTIINYKAYSLPSAGGMGSYPFTIFGMMVITIATSLLWERRKKTI